MGVKPRAIVETLPKYTPAKSIESVKREFGFEKVIKLAGNENTLGFSEKVIPALAESVSYYPDMEVTQLREKISEIWHVPGEQIIFGNGSFELLFLAGLGYLEPGDEAVYAEPSFNWYVNVTKIMNAVPVPVPLERFRVNLDRILNAVTEKTRIVWLCNPNNPTGTIFTQTQLTDFLEKLPTGILVVLDEAYIDFVEEEGYPDTIKLLENYDNLLILRTFSKVSGLAFFRIGYGFARVEVIDVLNKVRLPINTNGAAQLAALASLDDPGFSEKTVNNVREGRNQYMRAFERLRLDYVRSNTNFILFDIKRDSDPVMQTFLEHGILIRGGKEFGYPTMLRVSIGTREENEAVIRLLEEILTHET